eukprot:6458853-Amphidinium_carterae.1
MGQTEVRADLLALWVSASGDPDSTVPRWLVDGTPLGITAEMDVLPVFPAVTDSKFDILADLVNVPEGFTNYSSVEDDPHAELELE